jgi:hypothetical protein
MLSVVVIEGCPHHGGFERTSQRHGRERGRVARPRPDQLDPTVKSIKIIMSNGP